MKRCSILLVIVLLLIFIFAACSGGNGTSSDDIRVYVVTVQVVGEDGLPVNGVSVAGGDIFGSTEEGGTLERAMVDEGQFRQHLDATYQVEKSGCIVDRQQVLIDEKSDNFASDHTASSLYRAAGTIRQICRRPAIRRREPLDDKLLSGHCYESGSGRNCAGHIPSRP